MPAPRNTTCAPMLAAAGAAAQDVAALRAQLQLYNTMSRSKELFTTRPETPNLVQMYVCGVTVYDYSHIGEEQGAAPCVLACPAAQARALSCISLELIRHTRTWAQ